MTKTAEKPYPLGPNIPPANIKQYPTPNFLMTVLSINLTRILYLRAVKKTLTL